jgi:hypothetical protein
VLDNPRGNAAIDERIEEAMKLEFFEPAEAASVLKCSEAWLRDGAAKGDFPHSVWGKGKVVFTSAHLKEIAQLREVRRTSESPTSVRVIGTRARTHQKSS